MDMRRKFFSENYNEQNKVNSQFEVGKSTLTQSDLKKIGKWFKANETIYGKISTYDYDLKFFMVELYENKEDIKHSRLLPINAIMPLDQLEIKREEDTDLEKYIQNYIGRNIMAKIVHIDEETNAIVISRKDAQITAQEMVFEEVQKGDIVFSTVESFAFSNETKKAYAVFCSVNGTIGYLHKNDMAHYYIDDLRSELRTGDSLELVVKEIDKENKRLALALKPLIQDTIEEEIKQYKPSQMVAGSVVGHVNTSNRVIIEIKKGITMLCSVSKYKPEMGSSVIAVIKNINIEKKRISGYILRKVR